MKNLKTKALSLAAAAIIAASSACPVFAFDAAINPSQAADAARFAFNGLSIERIISNVLNNASEFLGKYISQYFNQPQAEEIPASPDAQENAAGAAEANGQSAEPGFALPESVKSSYVFKIADAGEYSGYHYKKLNGNVPVFADSDLAASSYEKYGARDRLGRCTAAIALLGQDLMPTQPRESIGMVKPTGWHTVRYDDIIEDKYLYNRSHLIAFSLAGENANEDNLITGTRYMNQEGMEPFESRVANYINRTGNHVLYRVTPIFEGNNLLASGVHMEAVSLEDSGEGIMFNVYVYNVQPGIVIDYTDGSSYAEIKDSEPAEPVKNNTSQNSGIADPGAQTRGDYSEYAYVLNKNSHKFHHPTCSSVAKMSEKNKCGSDLTREEIVKLGYDPCKICNP